LNILINSLVKDKILLSLRGLSKRSPYLYRTKKEWNLIILSFVARLATRNGNSQIWKAFWVICGRRSIGVSIYLRWLPSSLRRLDLPETNELRVLCL